MTIPLKAILLLILSCFLALPANAIIIGDPNAELNGTLLVQTTNTGYFNAMTLNGTVNPANGATRLIVQNPGSSLNFSAYGSGASGVLANSAGLIGSGNKFVIGSGVGAKLHFFANNAYANANGHMVIGTNGMVGIGTATPTSQLHVATGSKGYTTLLQAEGIVDPTTGSTRIRVGNPVCFVDMNAYGSGAPGVLAGSGAIVSQGASGTSFLVGGGANNSVKFFANNAYAGAGHLVIATTGKVGIGTASPSEALEVAGNMKSSGDISSVNGRFSGNVGIGTATPATLLDVAGEASVNVINIRGGSDVAERFDIAASAGQKVAPGMVVCIDPANPGKLVVSSKAYDKTIAGIVSGANGLSTGMMLSAKGTLAQGQYPVALTGRVYCMTDASNGAIMPGDMLTTSAVPGHAMKVKNHAKGQGAILGKAMTPLAKGEKGLVLVLVSLQ